MPTGDHELKHAQAPRPIKFLTTILRRLRLMKTNFKLSLFLALLITAFSAGHALGADCPYHQPSCSYAVSGCIQMTYSCGGNGNCWREFGKCCDDVGTDFSTYCGLGCDGNGGGTCGLEM